MDDHTFVSKYRLARVYEESRDLANAIRLYAELHQARPDASEVSEALFRDYFALKQYVEAEKILRDDIRNNSVSFETYINLGSVLAKLNKRSESIDAFDHALKLPSPYDKFYTINIVAQMMEAVGFQEDALAMLIRERKSADDVGGFSREIADLYFKMGKYEQGSSEYLELLRHDELNLELIKQSISKYTADSTSRLSIIRVITSHIGSDATLGELKLLGWCYGELKNYKGALDVFLKIDNLNSPSSTQQIKGFELFQFASRVRHEGAFDVASQAYHESMVRFRNGNLPEPQKTSYIAMAELGSLQTKEAYYRSLSEPSRDSIDLLIAAYLTFAAKQPNEVAFDALVAAGNLALNPRRDFLNAKSIFEKIVSRSNAYSERLRDAYFSLEQIALARGDLNAADASIDAVDKMLSRRNRKEDAETFRHILFERAKRNFYNGAFDSAIVLLDSIITEPTSDYANDAIGLRSLISENMSNVAALRLYAKADFASLGNDLNAAYSAFKSIPESYPTATIADEATLRAIDLLVQMNKPTDALVMIASMLDKMSTSPLLDKAAFREAEITEVQLKDKAKARRLYEDFLERFAKSPLTTEARRRARTLRGDSF